MGYPWPELVIVSIALVYILRRNYMTSARVAQTMTTEEQASEAPNKGVKMIQSEDDTASPTAIRLQHAELSHRERNLNLMNKQRSPEERRARWRGTEEARQRDRLAQILAWAQDGDDKVEATTENGSNNPDIIKSTEQTSAQHHLAQDTVDFVSITKPCAAQTADIAAAPRPAAPPVLVTPSTATEQDEFVNIDLGKPPMSSVEPDDAKEWVVVPDS